MRVWDIPVEQLCRKHLLGQHNEIHIMYKTIQTGRKAWANHPETKRWRGKEHALKATHDATAAEMLRRGYNHKTPLPDAHGINVTQDTFIHTIPEQYQILKNKGCECDLSVIPWVHRDWTEDDLRNKFPDIIIL